ncbi:MAG: aminopeptidase [Candidatus Sumerlaeota bacterium]|nr:aminopeptidase [Candidatus Sumerlaeota bacterium]
MLDPRIEKLASIVVDYSTRVKKDDAVLIQFSGAAPLPLARAIYRRCLRRGAKLVDVRCQFPEINRDFYDCASQAQLSSFPQHELSFMKKVDVFIGIRGEENAKTLASVDSQRLLSRTKVMRPIQDYRVKHTRWVVMIYPTPAMAQDADMSLDEFEDFVFGACLRDWAGISAAMAKLEKRLTRAKQVRIKASDTDLRFAKKGIPAIKCDGQLNMPDGEVFTAPEKTSVEGFIQYNATSRNLGRDFNNVRLEFSKGRIIKASCSGGSEAQKALDAIFNTDEGARYIGEFAIGVNQGIQRAIKSTLFDEKIGGSIHLTPGQCYDEAPNGNKSAIHWDLVKILNGDGELYLDGELIQQNGKFITADLKPLNK